MSFSCSISRRSGAAGGPKSGKSDMALWRTLNRALSKSVTAPALADAKKQGAVLAWGNFVTIVINFLIIAWVLFLVVRGLNRLIAKEAEKPAKPAEAPRSEVLLQEIRDILASKPGKPA